MNEVIVPTTIQEAREQGSVFYFTGRPCKNGHIANRRTMNANCVECEKQVWKTWRNRKAYAYRDHKRWAVNNTQKYLWMRARAGAKKRRIPFTIQPEDIVIPTHCPLLGIELTLPCSGQTSMSVDRIDNTRGYEKGNVWVISTRANIIKGDATLAELQLITKALEKIYK